MPQATSTSPPGSRVAVEPTRAVVMLPVTGRRWLIFMAPLRFERIGALKVSSCSPTGVEARERPSPGHANLATSGPLLLWFDENGRTMCLLVRRRLDAERPDAGGCR